MATMLNTCAEVHSDAKLRWNSDSGDCRLLVGSGGQLFCVTCRMKLEHRCRDGHIFGCKVCTIIYGYSFLFVEIVYPMRIIITYYGYFLGMVYDDTLPSGSKWQIGCGLSSFITSHEDIAVDIIMRHHEPMG